VLPPALLAAALMTAACVLGRWHESFVLVGSCVAVAASLALGCQTDNRLPWHPDAAGWHWLLWTALAAVATDALARLPRIPNGVGWALRGMVAAQAGWLLTSASLRDETIWAPFAVGAVVLVEWALLEQVGRLDRRGLIAFVLATGANVAALVLIYAASARFGNVALVLMAVLGGAGLPALIFGRETNGVAGAVAVLLPGLLLSGQQDTFSEVPVTCFALAAFCPLALAPSLLPAWQRYQKKGLWTVQLLLFLLPLAGAVYLAAQTGALDFE
jgi:hypothetical protein